MTFVKFSKARLSYAKLYQIIYQFEIIKTFLFLKFVF